MLWQHLNPTPITIAERYKFYERNQNADETLSEYISAVRKLTELCEFSAFLNEALRDKFVCGMQKQNIRKRMLA